MCIETGADFDCVNTVRARHEDHWTECSRHGQIAWDELFTPEGGLNETAKAAVYACICCCVWCSSASHVRSAAVNAKALLHQAILKRRRRRTVIRVADEPEVEEAIARERIIAGKRARRQQMVRSGAPCQYACV